MEKPVSFLNWEMLQEEEEEEQQEQEQQQIRRPMTLVEIPHKNRRSGVVVPCHPNKVENRQTTHRRSEKQESPGDFRRTTAS